MAALIIVLVHVAGTFVAAGVFGKGKATRGELALGHVGDDGTPINAGIVVMVVVVIVIVIRVKKPRRLV